MTYILSKVYFVVANKDEFYIKLAKAIGIIEEDCFVDTSKLKRMFLGVIKYGSFSIRRNGSYLFQVDGEIKESQLQLRFSMPGFWLRMIKYLMFILVVAYFTIVKEEYICALFLAVGLFELFSVEYFATISKKRFLEIIEEIVNSKD